MNDNSHIDEWIRHQVESQPVEYNSAHWHHAQRAIRATERRRLGWLIGVGGLLLISIVTGFGLYHLKRTEVGQGELIPDKAAWKQMVMSEISQLKLAEPTASTSTSHSESSVISAQNRTEWNAYKANHQAKTRADSKEGDNLSSEPGYQIAGVNRTSREAALTNASGSEIETIAVGDKAQKTTFTLPQNANTSEGTDKPSHEQLRNLELMLSPAVTLKPSGKIPSLPIEYLDQKTTGSGINQTHWGVIAGAHYNFHRKLKLPGDVEVGGWLSMPLNNRISLYTALTYRQLQPSPDTFMMESTSYGFGFTRDSYRYSSFQMHLLQLPVAIQYSMANVQGTLGLIAGYNLVTRGDIEINQTASRLEPTERNGFTGNVPGFTRLALSAMTGVDYRLNGHWGLGLTAQIGLTNLVQPAYRSQLEMAKPISLSIHIKYLIQ